MLLSKFDGVFPAENLRKLHRLTADRNFYEISDVVKKQAFLFEEQKKYKLAMKSIQLLQHHPSLNFPVNGLAMANNEVNHNSGGTGTSSCAGVEQQQQQTMLNLSCAKVSLYSYKCITNFLSMIKKICDADLP